MTLREHLEAIRDERNRVHEGDSFVAYCESMARVTEHAEAAQAILDGAVRDYVVGDGKCVLIVDEAPSGGSHP